MEPVSLSQPLLDRGVTIDEIRYAADHIAPMQSHIFEMHSVIQAVEDQSEGGVVTADSLKCVIDSLHIGYTISLICRAVINRPEVMKVADWKEMALDNLVAHWMAMKYWDRSTYPKREIFGQRETSEAVGVDIGSGVRTDMEGFFRGYVAGVYQRMLRSLNHWGFVVMKEAVPRDQICHIHSELGITTDHASVVGEYILNKDPNISHSRASANRLQLLLRGSRLEELTSALHTYILPLVTGWYDRRYINPPRVILSDVRLVVVDHAAHPTNWTVYNPKGGLSVMIPLQDRNTNSGSQAFIPGSHFLLDGNMGGLNRLASAIQRYFKAARPLKITDMYDDGVWRAGDAFIFDNHLLIHGEENKLFKSGAYILMKYETANQAPPDLYLKGKILFRLGSLLDRIAIMSRPM